VGTSGCSSVEFRCYIIVLLINVLLDFKFIMLSRDVLLAIGLVSSKLDTLTRQSVARLPEPVVYAASGCVPGVQYRAKLKLPWDIPVVAIHAVI